MTKPEEKLIELGYEQYNDTRLYSKPYLETNNEIIIVLNFERNDINIYKVFCPSSFYKQQQVNDLQQAFNVMKQDLEELKKYEKEN